MATTRHNMLRGAILLGVGIAIGAAFSAHTTSAQPSSPAPCTTTHKTPAPRTSTTRRTYVTDNQSGVSVQAGTLRVDKGTLLPPAAGHVYIAVHVLLHNGAKTAHDYNADDFTLHGQRDQVDYQPDFGDSKAQGQGLQSGKIAAGASIAGDVAFAVPSAPQHYALHWTPTFDATPLIVPLNR